MKSLNFFPETFPLLRFCRRIALLLVLLTLGSAVAMAAPAWLRAKIVGDGIVNAIKVAPDKTYYVAGQTEPTKTASMGALDIFLARYSESGKLLWMIVAGGPENDQAMGVDLDPQGNVYLTGMFTDTAIFPSVGSAAAVRVNGPGQTIFLAKYDSDGNLLWINTGTAYSGATNSGYGIAVDPSGNGAVYIIAITQGTTTFSSQNGVIEVVSGTNSWHMILARFDLYGDFDWANVDQAAGNSIPRGITVDGAGGVYVTGWFEDEVTFSSMVGDGITLEGFSPAGLNIDYPDDAFLVKYNAVGDVRWANHIGGYKAIGNALTAKPGEVTLVGFVGNVNDLSPSYDDTLVTSLWPSTTTNIGGGHFTDPYNADAVFATYTDTGHLKRAIRFGTSAGESAKGAAYDGAGDLYIVGLSQAASAKPNLFVLKYEASNLLWELKAENAGIWVPEGVSPAISIGHSGKILVAGEFTGTAKFGSIHLSAGSATDMFVAELAK